MINKDIYIGDTPEQLGCITASEAIIIDGKIVTREDVRRLQSEIEAFKSLYSAAKGSADKLNEMLCGAKEERNELAATVEALRANINNRMLEQARKDKNAALSALFLMQSKAVYAYNCGYLAGHTDTVEGVYVDIHHLDKASYNSDVVQELVGPFIDDPQKHLRDVLAEAGRAGYWEGVTDYQEAEMKHEDFWLDKRANQYAASVKAGEK